ncbi:unnamed protein product [Camellia sinensis]
MIKLSRSSSMTNRNSWLLKVTLTMPTRPDSEVFLLLSLTSSTTKAGSSQGAGKNEERMSFLLPFLTSTWWKSWSCKKYKLRHRYPCGESYLDVIQSAVLRALYSYFADRPLKEVPHNEMPLHTIIEMQMGLTGVQEKRCKLVDIAFLRTVCVTYISFTSLKPSIITASLILSASLQAFPAQFLQRTKAVLHCHYIDK